VSGRPTALVFVLLLLARGSGCAGPESSGAAPEVAAPRAPEPSPAPEPAALVDEPAAVVVPPGDPAPEPVLPASGPPEDFGQIRPPLPVPAADELTVHAVAGYEVVAVYSLPDLSSPRLGYLRIGQRAMVTPRIDDRGEGCDKGFHALAAGGFACASKGLIVATDKPPYVYLPPPPPRTDSPIPYDYGVITQDGTPMWWRIPDSEEVMLAAQKYKALVAAEQAAAAGQDAPTAKPKKPGQAAPGADPPVTPEPGAGSGAQPAPAGSGAAEPAPAGAGAGDPEAKKADAGDPDARKVDAADPAPDSGAAGSEPPDAPPPELSAEEKAAIAKQQAAARKRAEARKKEQQAAERALARKRARLPLNSQVPFMEHGFVVTLGNKVKVAGQQWWKTTRGGFIQASKTRPKGTMDFHGGEVPEEGRFAFGFVEGERAPAAVMTEKGELKWKRRLEERQLVAFREEAEVGGRTYLVTSDGLYMRRSDLRMARIAARPEGVMPWERWIDVDLELQLLVAYEGDVPVYATLISSGKRGSEEESFLTPKGVFRIGAKHISSSMDGNTASDGRYSIQDVPWAMFFEGNYALHGAFWHSKFGSRRSHGCVNLGPSDARWLFNWTTPFVPEGWHGVNAHEGAPGSVVVIH
jgi:hypothetical protein